MTTQTEALKLEIEALEKLIVGSEYEDAVRAEKAITAIKEALAQPEQEPVYREYQTADGIWHMFANNKQYINTSHNGKWPWPIRALYTTPPQRKPLTDEQTIILKGATCPEIDWKARHFVEMNNGERNEWMLEWFMAFKVAIEAAHGIKENT